MILMRNVSGTAYVPEKLLDKERDMPKAFMESPV